MHGPNGYGFKATGRRPRSAEVRPLQAIWLECSWLLGRRPPAARRRPPRRMPAKRQRLCSPQPRQKRLPFCQAQRRRSGGLGHQARPGGPRADGHGGPRRYRRCPGQKRAPAAQGQSRPQTAQPLYDFVFQAAASIMRAMRTNCARVLEGRGSAYGSKRAAANCGWCWSTCATDLTPPTQWKNSSMHPGAPLLKLGRCGQSRKIRPLIVNHDALSPTASLARPGPAPACTVCRLLAARLCFCWKVLPRSFPAAKFCRAPAADLRVIGSKSLFLICSSAFFCGMVLGLQGSHPGAVRWLCGTGLRRISDPHP